MQKILELYILKLYTDDRTYRFIFNLEVKVQISSYNIS